MATAGSDTLDTASLQVLLGPHLTAEQAASICRQGEEAVDFTLLSLAKQLAEKQSSAATAPDPAAPSGQTPPYVKLAAKTRAKPNGAKPGHPGHRRPAPPQGNPGKSGVLRPIMPLDLPVKVRPWELTVYPRSHIRR